MTEESFYLSFYGIRVWLHLYTPELKPGARVLLLGSPLVYDFHWRKVLPELLQMNCLVAVVDMPGFGHSDCGVGVPQDVETRSGIIWGVLDEVDAMCNAYPATWHLVSHGTGMQTLLEMAQMHPDSVSSLVFLSPLSAPPVLPRHTDLGTWYDAQLQRAHFKKTMESFAAYPLDDFIVNKFRQPFMRQNAQDSVAKMLRSGQHQTKTGLGFCPAMVIHGGIDPLLTETEKTRLNERLKEAETHTLKTAGHFPMETHSKALRDYLRGWLMYNGDI